MADKPKDVGSKLSAPMKKSLFERQRAEAEAKRQRQEKETAAVYEDFVKSFDDPEPAGNTLFNYDQGTSAAPAPGKRHFSASANRPGLARGLRGPPRGPRALRPEPATQASHQHGEEEPQEKKVPRPTLRMTSLPPGIAPGAIKAVIPSSLSVDAVQIINSPPPAVPTADRRSATAIVTLAQGTPATEIDSVVNTLQNRYMGRGYWLSISRHLSSAAVNDVTLHNLSGTSSLPFGARAIVNHGLHRGGFAPPSSLTASADAKAPAQFQVQVKAPSNLVEVRMIHKVLESLIKYGPEFEALLMTRRQVQKEEKWAWIWDSRSTGGVYYRWKLWELLSGNTRQRSSKRDMSACQIFDNYTEWTATEASLPFEFVSQIEGIVSDGDYDSSDEDSADERDASSYLNPLRRAKLSHLLARLPTSNARLRRGDVARVTAFAIQHAGRGADEIARIVTLNACRPLALTSANPYAHAAKSPLDGKEKLDPAMALSTNTNGRTAAAKELQDEATPAKLVGLYVISDILSSSSNSGVRHAWRYRQSFETQLKMQQVFEQLGRLDIENNWGRLRGEKWRRSIHSILALWESWCVFPQAVQEHFTQAFDRPSVASDPARVLSDQAKRSAKSNRWKTVNDDLPQQESNADGGRSASVKDDGQSMDDVDGEPIDNIDGVPMDDVDGEPMDDVDGEPMDDVDGEPMDDVDGEPMDDVDEVPTADSYGEPATTLDGVPMDGDDGDAGSTKLAKQEVDQNDATQPDGAETRRAALAASIAAKMVKPASPDSALDSTSTARKRPRPKAEDMFASDEE